MSDVTKSVSFCLLVQSYYTGTGNSMADIKCRVASSELVCLKCKNYQNGLHGKPRSHGAELIYPDYLPQVWTRGQQYIITYQSTDFCHVFHKHVTNFNSGIVGMKWLGRQYISLYWTDKSILYPVAQNIKWRVVWRCSTVTLALYFPLPECNPK